MNPNILKVKDLNESSAQNRKKSSNNILAKQKLSN